MDPTSVPNPDRKKYFACKKCFTHLIMKQLTEVEAEPRTTKKCYGSGFYRVGKMQIFCNET